MSEEFDANDKRYALYWMVNGKEELYGKFVFWRDLVDALEVLVKDMMSCEYRIKINTERQG